MRWGFIGIGRVTPRMVEAVRQAGHEVHLAAARNLTALRAWGDQHSVKELTTDLESVCRAPNVDAIYVALPPSLHAEFVKIGIQQGKHVLCEKPIGMNAIEAEQLASLSRRPGQNLTHATAFPFHPRSEEIRRRILSGEIGDIRRVSVACSFSHVLSRGRDYRTDPRLGGGCLLDLGWYAVFATLWLTGQRPTRILGMGSQVEGADASQSDCVEQGISVVTAEHRPSDSLPLLQSAPIWISNQAIAELDGGAVAHWDCGFDVPGRKWIEIAGTKGSIVCDDLLRPWNAEKPRFWRHAEDGKAEQVIVGEQVNQEAIMVRASTDPAMHEETSNLFQLGVETQRILERWEKSCLVK